MDTSPIPSRASIAHRPTTLWLPTPLAYLLAGSLSALQSLAASSPALDPSKLPAPASSVVEFDRDIRPLFEKSCLRCHGPEKPKSGFRLDQQDAALKGGKEGVNILPGRSAESRIVHYVAHLVPDMEMPPEGKGEKWTDSEIGLLRAWIDQGAKWGNRVTLEQYKLAMNTTVGFTTVKGNEAKFSEHFWQPQGVNGGIESLELSNRIGKESKLSLQARLLRDDYKITLDIAQPQLGSVQFGWEQFRKYSSDVGGYHSLVTPSEFRLEKDLGLDIGRAWIDLSLNRPSWPSLKLGYEYQYRKGSKSMTSWGQAGSAAGSGLDIYPAFKVINESVHILKFDLDHSFSGYRLQDQFRGQFYDLNSGRKHVTYFDTTGAGVTDTQRINESVHYFQGMNALRLEKQFKDWLFGSAGYLYSRLEGESSVGLVGTTYAFGGFNLNGQLAAQDIILERESHVVNANALLGPWEGLTFTLGTQAEWTRQSGVGHGVFDDGFVGPVEQSMAANGDKALIEEHVALRFTKIPSTVLFAEARLRQESADNYQEQIGGLGGGFDFLRENSIASQRRDWRVGFSSSPVSRVTFGGHYRQRDYSDHYKSRRDESPIGTVGDGYPAFIRSREGMTDEIEGRCAIRINSWLRTTLTYKWSDTDYFTDTDSVAVFSVPGGGLYSGKQNANTYGFNATLTPWQRVHLSTSFTYRNTRTTVENNDFTSVVPFKGDLYTLVSSATYVLSPSTDLTGSYTYSRAEYGQDNFTSGLPVGLNYDLHGLQTGIGWKFRKNMTARLQYGFYTYDERNTGGWNNYVAHAIFATLTVRTP